MTLWRVVLVGVVIAGVLVAAFVLFWPSLRQNVIFPGGTLMPGQGDPALWGLPSAEEVRLTTADGVRIHGWWAPARSGDPCGALIYFHGNANTIAPRAWLAERFSDRGLDVLLFDYRGYGLSEGEPDGAGLREDARAAWEHVTRARSIPPGRVILFGNSLGSAVAAELALDRPDAAGLVLGAPFPGFPVLFRHHAPWLPTGLLPWADDRFDAASGIAGLRMPVLILAGEADRLIPARFSRTVYEAAPEPREWVLAPAQHNTLIGHPVSWAALDRFLAGTLGCAPAPEGGARAAARRVPGPTTPQPPTPQTSTTTP